MGCFQENKTQNIYYLYRKDSKLEYNNHQIKKTNIIKSSSGPCKFKKYMGYISGVGFDTKIAF